MKNVNDSLRRAYYDILTGILSGVEVYQGMAPDTATGSYVIIAEINSPQGQDKSHFKFDANILLDIVIKNGSFGYKDSDAIASQIIAIVNSDNNPDLSPDFQCVTTVMANMFNLPGLNPTEPTFRTLIRFNHIIHQH